MSKKQQQKQLVIVTWMPAHGEISVATIAYDNGRGPVRIYERDRYDGRCNLGRTEPLPFFATAEEAMRFMALTRGQDSMCQVACGEAHHFGFEDGETTDGVAVRFDGRTKTGIMVVE